MTIIRTCGRLHPNGPKPVSGTEWTDEENDAIVADYFAMLADELAGVSYVKAHHNAALVQLSGRSRGSVERKYMNISAVLMKLGLPRIRGYAPNANAQFSALADAIERHLDRHHEFLDPPAPSPILLPNADPFVSVPMREAYIGCSSSAQWLKYLSCSRL